MCVEEKKKWKKKEKERHVWIKTNKYENKIKNKKLKLRNVTTIFFWGEGEDARFI